MAAPWAGLDGEPIYEAIEEFVTGSRPAMPSTRVLTTILALDIVASTETTIAAGDRAWRELLDAHYALVRNELARWRGVLIDTAGDGLLATFDGPARAVRFGFAMIRADRELGLEIRVGVHCGEVERADNAIRGISVTLTARILSAAKPAEVLVSTTIRDLTAGSGLRFEDGGMHGLKGIPEPRQLLRAVE
jgi:class 3 adenylate cyclase